MLNTENIYVILFALPVYQLLFYSVQLITVRKKSNRVIFPIGLLVTLMTLFLVMNAIYFLGYDQTFSYIYPFFIPVFLMILPTFYLFSQSITGNFSELEIRRLIVLYLPSLFILVLNFISYGVMDNNEHMLFLQAGFHFPEGMNHSHTLAEQIFWLGNVGFLAAQLVLTFIKTYQIAFKTGHTQELHPSYLPYLRIDWIWILLVSIFLFTLSISLMILFTPRELIWAVVFNAIMLLTGAFTGYFGMKQYQLYRQVEKIPVMNNENIAGEIKQNNEAGSSNPIIGIQNNVSGEETPGAVPAAFNMDSEQIQLIVHELRHLMATEKLYLNSRLTIMDIAHKLKISRRLLSYLINDVLKTNYYGLVNEYRVMEAKEILKRPEYNNLTIEAIANQCGFKSKSSFNACFKKVTGKTPSEYKNGLKNKKAGN